MRREEKPWEIFETLTVDDTQKRGLNEVNELMYQEQLVSDLNRQEITKRGRSRYMVSKMKTFIVSMEVGS